jgi:hypothetical protein
MLTDPFVLKAPNLGAHTTLTASETISLARVQEQGGVAAYGPSLLVNGQKVAMKVSHSESNENKPDRTRRVMVRLDVTGVTPDGSPSTAFAYAVFGLPDKGVYASVASAAADASDTVDSNTLLNLLVGVLAVSNSAYTTDETRVPRLMAGES